MSFIRSGGVRILLVLTLVVAFAGGSGAAWIWWKFLRDLPDLESVEDYQPALTTKVLDRDGTLIGIYANEQRQLVPMDSLPEHVGLAFVAAEDSNFFQHAGIDYVSIVRAAWVDLRARGIKQGASTITMQLVKQLLLSPERRFSRKLREMWLARQIEQHFSKQEILYLYLNQIYFGSGAWGIGQAAETYFDKPAAELTVGESALLAGLPQRPSAYSPFRAPELAESRRRYVLGRMLDDEIIDQATYDDALANPPALSERTPNPNFANASHFTEEVRRYLFDRLGGDMVLEGGLVIETTLDAELQAAAVKSVRAGLQAHDRRRGYRGPVRQVPQPDVAAEIARLGEENELLPEAPADDAPKPNEGDAKTAEEDSQLAEQEVEPAAPVVIPELPLDDPKLGVVTRVDLDGDYAMIAFADGVMGQAALKDVSWAREPDIERRPRSVKHIEKIFAVGDVARFIRLEGEPLVFVEEEKEEDKAESPEDASVPVTPALARVDLYQDPEVEGALLSMDVETGDVRAMVGGYDYGRSQFNRATQALRQPGSAFKPFIYGAALSREYTPVSTLWDRPAVYEDPVSGFVWRPQNYGRHFYGPMPLRQALVRSVNNATVHLFRDVGVDYVIDYARRLGIQSPLSRDLSLALGSSSLGLVELTTAYAVYPNQGRRVVPRFITKVSDREGNVLLEDVPLGTPPPPVLKPLAMESELAIEGAEEVPTYPDAEILPTDQVISEAAAYLMCDLLKGVVFDPRGTGHRLRKLGRPLAGKTGTTNDQKDAWFMGFSPGVVTGVWVGRDDSKVLGWGETGSRAAAPIWVEYMGAALDGRPIVDFDEPEHIVKVRIDRKSGLLADANSPEAYFQPFLEGSEPEESTASQKTAGDVRRALREDFF